MKTRFIEVIVKYIFLRKTFISFSALLIFYNIIGTAFLYSWGGSDYWEHLAAINSFAINPLQPPNPYILSNSPTHLHTPYHFLWGTISHLLSIHPLWLFPFISGTNIFLFLLAVSKFCEHIIEDKKYALILATTMLVHWIYPWRFSGVYNFGLLPLTSVYPYWFAFPVSLLVISLFYSNNLSKNFFINLVKILSYIFLVSLIFLIHPLTGIFLVISISVIALIKKSPTSYYKPIILLIPLFAILISFMWPFFPVFDAIIGSKSYDNVGFGDDWKLFYKFSIIRISPALIGLPLFISSLIRKKFNYLNITLSLLITIYTFNYFLIHNTVASRVIIFIALICQIGTVLLIKSLESSNKFVKSLSYYSIASLILLIPQLYQSLDRIGPIKDFFKGAVLGTYSNINIYNNYSPLKKYIKHNDVVLAPMKHSWALAGLLGCKVVGVEHSNPFMKDYFQRKSDTESFFSEQTSNFERAKIIKKYSVNYILVPFDFKYILGNKLEKIKLIYKGKDYNLYLVTENSMISLI